MEKRKIALIIGIAGQDAAYLAKLLLSKDYKVVGIDYKIRESYWRLIYLGLLEEVEIVKLDTLNRESFGNYLKELQPDEIYNLSGLSSVSKSFQYPIVCIEQNVQSFINLLEIVRAVIPRVKVFQASSGEMYGNSSIIEKTEESRFQPVSPYGASKLLSHNLVKIYRESYNLFVVSGILFNHESPLRGDNFVTKKITSSVAKIKYSQLDYLEVGNLNVKRDWGHARDYVDVIWLMLNQANADDFIISSGKIHSLRQFIEISFYNIGMDIIWEGTGLEEIGIEKSTGRIRVKVSAEFFRPIDLNDNLGNNTKARNLLNWKPKSDFNGLIKEMVGFDLKNIGFQSNHLVKL